MAALINSNPFFETFQIVPLEETKMFSLRGRLRCFIKLIILDVDFSLKFGIQACHTTKRFLQLVSLVMKIFGAYLTTPKNELHAKLQIQEQVIDKQTNTVWGHYDFKKGKFQDSFHKLLSLIYRIAIYNARLFVGITAHPGAALSPSERNSPPRLLQTPKFSKSMENILHTPL